VKALLNEGVSARPPKREREAACAPQKPALSKTGLGPCLTDITDAGYNRSPITKKALGSVKSMAAAEAWDAALPLAQTWVMGSVAV
jgi:hypothetical protein